MKSRELLWCLLLSFGLSATAFAQQTAQDTSPTMKDVEKIDPKWPNTALGRYKAKVWRAVGARWYQKVAKEYDLIPAGIVHIQYTIHADGTVNAKVLDNGGGVQRLLSISFNSIQEAAPFDPFTDAMRKEVGDSYMDNFTFAFNPGDKKPGQVPTPRESPPVPSAPSGPPGVD